MSAGSLAALVTAVSGLVAAVGALVAAWRHATGPQHSGPVRGPETWAAGGAAAQQGKWADPKAPAEPPPGGGTGSG